MNRPVTTLLRQRAPFLFLDDYRPLADGQGIEGWFRFSGEEAYFRGHFPGDPVVPGVLLIEAMAQAGRVALALRFGRMRPGRLARVDSARFNAPVCPPAQVRLVARTRAAEDLGSGFAVLTCSTHIDGIRAARADLTLSLDPE